MTKPIIIAVALCFTAGYASAQRDTTKTQSIDITSSFKPVLRNAVKINFSGSQLVADSSRPVLGYTIPAQNLFYAYQPIALKPLALVQDTNLYLGGRNFIKAGFGTYSTPYVSAGLSFGNGKTSLINLYGTYTGSKGKDLPHQDYAQLDIKGTGSYFTAKNEVYTSLAVSQHNYYLYGYDHNTYDYKKDDLRQQFQDITVSGGIRNTVATTMGINYNPNIQLSFFTNKDKLTETTLKFETPAEKKIGDEFIAMVSAKGDFTNYSTKGLANDVKLSNNIIQLAPAIEYKTRLVKFHGGLTPSWSNGEFKFLPDIFAEVQLQEKVLMLQGGWVGRYTKNTFRNLTQVNPYLQTLLTQQNTREVEYYGGIKATIGKHFNFNAKAGVISYKDLPFFINDTSGDEKAFLLSYEPSVNNFRVHGDVSYINQDKFTATAGVTFNGYTGMKVNDKAWHTLPMEFTSSLRWWAYEKLMLKADFYFFNGGSYLTKPDGNMPLNGGTDLSAGAEFKINKQFSAWGSVSNILNDKYERWHNYQVYGINATVGILINF